MHEELRDWVILGDLPARTRQTALDWAPHAGQFLLVVEPTWQALLTARRLLRCADIAKPGARVSLVVNKSTGAADAERAAALLEMPVLGVVPVDDDVRRAERAGVAVLD